MAREGRWIKLFREFVKDLRISSKEVVSQDERGVKLDLWESQKRYLEEIAQGLEDGVRIFNCLKSRQLGVTTISLAVDLFWLAIHSNLTGALVSDTEKNRDINRSILEGYVKSFPEDYFGGKFGIKKANRQFILFTNGSRFDLLVAGTKKKSVSWGEGVGYAMAHETEVASYGDVDGLSSFEESWAQENPNRLFMRESTAKGVGNAWHDRWVGGLSKGTERSFFIGWWASKTNVIWPSDPRFAEYGMYAASGEERELVAAVARLYGHRITEEQLAWIRWKEANAPSTESDMLAQNQPWTAEQSFILSGYSFFQTRMLGQDLKRLTDDETLMFSGYQYHFGQSFFDMQLEYLEPEEENRPRIELSVYKRILEDGTVLEDGEPSDNGQYVIGADPAWGRSEQKDRHVASVWRCFADRMVQVAEFATHEIEVKHFAWVIAHLAGAYRNCMINVEIGGPGRMILLEWEHIRGLLQAEMNQQFVQSHDWENALGQARWYLYNRPDSMGRGFAYGWETTWRTQQELMHGFRSAYVTKELDIRSKALLHEMRIVVVDGAHIGAPESRSENSKDDRVYAAALAHRAWVNWIRPGLLAEGKTYEAVMAEERGQTTPQQRNIMGQVYRFLKTQEELAEEHAAARTWRQDFGLE